ncbi:hypothetical protein EKG83_14165 [Saccharothrix syringae]|uniref:Uncharacterized protein n=1 Tax=Saccharothrix syringae TaxID=103733 RepID=A0A5Q0GWW5_SACSY|nr:hypothetical protein EKG83_14165 [Saccharothrix syringae]
MREKPSRAIQRMPKYAFHIGFFSTDTPDRALPSDFVMDRHHTRVIVSWLTDPEGPAQQATERR